MLVCWKTTIKCTWTNVYYQNCSSHGLGKQNWKLLAWEVDQNISLNFLIVPAESEVFNQPLMFSSYRTQSIGLLWKLIGWFLYNCNINHWCVTTSLPVIRWMYIWIWVETIFLKANYLDMGRKLLTRYPKKICLCAWVHCE